MEEWILMLIKEGGAFAVAVIIVWMSMRENQRHVEDVKAWKQEVKDWALQERADKLDLLAAYKEASRAFTELGDVMKQVQKDSGDSRANMIRITESLSNKLDESQKHLIAHRRIEEKFVNRLSKKEREELEQQSKG